MKTWQEYLHEGTDLSTIAGPSFQDVFDDLDNAAASMEQWGEKHQAVLQQQGTLRTFYKYMNALTDTIDAFRSSGFKDPYEMKEAAKPSTQSKPLELLWILQDWKEAKVSPVDENSDWRSFASIDDIATGNDSLASLWVRGTNEAAEEALEKIGAQALHKMLEEWSWEDPKPGQTLAKGNVVFTMTDQEPGTVVTVTVK